MGPDLSDAGPRIWDMERNSKRFLALGRVFGAVAITGACLLVMTQLVNARTGESSPVGAGGDLTAETSSVISPYGVSAQLPDRWQMSADKLVPKLVSPREIAAFGTFEMPVGGGGNCGRYPTKALSRMTDDDALIQIQETYVATGAKWLKSQPSRPTEFPVEAKRYRDSGVRGIWGQQISFRAGPRYFDILIAFGSAPSKSAITEAEEVLNSLDFAKIRPWGRSAPAR